MDRRRKNGLSNTETQLLIGSLGMLGCGMAFLAAALLVSKGNATARRWFGSQVKFYIRFGIFATVSGLLNLGRLVVPDTFASGYATFFLVSTIVLVVGLIGASMRDWRARHGK